MKAQDEFYQAVLGSISDGVYLCDSERRISYWSPGAERITGYSAEEVCGTSCADNLLMHVDDSGVCLCKGGCPLSATLLDKQPREAEVYLHHKKGHRVPVLLRTSPILTPTGEVDGVVEVFTDNSKLLAALKRVEELSVESETDPLTGVGNRRLMQIKLESCVAERRRAALSAGVLFIDIDHFKEVNDSFGHETGDRVLKMVADTLRHNLRASDTLARWGGEEFLALLLQIDERNLAAMAEKLRMLVANSYLNYGGIDLRVTISLGATLIRPRDTVRTLVARADRLLYESKTKGRNRSTLAA